MTTRAASRLTILLTVALTSVFGPGVAAQQEWRYGIGTGLSTLSLDGDIGFDTTAAGPIVADVDLDNGDTRDLLRSGFGLAGFAAKGKWSIRYGLGSVTLEDRDAGITAEWDKTQAELAAVYNVAKGGNHVWGVLLGARRIDHEWKISTLMERINIDESWTDALIGVTHRLPLTETLSWGTRLDGGFGDSDSAFRFDTGLDWRVAAHWGLNVSVRLSSIEFEKGSPGDSGYYLYDVEERGVGLGFAYLF